MNFLTTAIKGVILIFVDIKSLLYNCLCKYELHDKMIQVMAIEKMRL